MFTTMTFWATFIVFIMIFAFLRHYTRLGMMLYVTGFSLAFYYNANQEMMFVLPAVALFTWGMTAFMNHLDGVWRKLMMILIVITDLTPLLFFKYTNFALTTWNAMLQTNFSLMSIIVPVGISFFTFQAISYVVDVYKRKFTESVNILEFFFYLTFFPLLMAGPITRAGHFFPQVKNLKPITERMLYTGLWLVMLGLLKKLVIADYIAQFNDWVFDDPTAYSGYEALMAFIGYPIQIYCDFSGYSDMSIGMAMMMGIVLKENFNLPYQSLNVSEFWRRWHISLSTWFRDYLYIPMGGNRKGKVRTYLNNFITMLVAGLWHGSTPMFIIWGGLHGIGLIVQKMCKRFTDRLPDNAIVTFCSWALTTLFIAVTWVFFRAQDVPTSLELLRRAFTEVDWAYIEPFFMARPTWVVMMLIAIAFHFTRREQHQRIIRWFVLSPWLFKVIAFLLVIQLCIQFHTSNVQPFIYYQF